MKLSRTMLVTILVVALCGLATEGLAKKKAKGKKKKKKENITKIIPKKEFTEALIKLAKDEREPVASSTLVEKGRGADYYAVDKMLDDNPETFWAEGAEGSGNDQFVVFFVPDGTTHVEITPGAGKEQFENFNRPKHLYVDYYFVKLKRDKDTEEYKPKFKWLGRSDFKFKDKPQTVRRKVGIKLPEVVLAERTMYVGVIIFRKVYKGQFDDTSIAALRTSAVWGAE